MNHLNTWNPNPLTVSAETKATNTILKVLIHEAN